MCCSYFKCGLRAISKTARIEGISVKKARQRSHRQHADDDHHDNQLDQGKAGIFHRCSDCSLVGRHAGHGARKKREDVCMRPSR